MEKVYCLYLRDNDTLIGKLYADSLNGTEVYSFEYNLDFIVNHPDFYLDPDLYPFKGRQYPKDKKIFGFISDLMPDRWGRALIDRNERNKAKKENRKQRTLLEIDYLINTLDISRAGAIRIKEENANIFLAPALENIPPYISLRKLEQASLKYEDDFYNDNLIQLLLAPGSSLGGARPKANIYNNNNEIYIAKFPSKKDSYDVALWEKVVNELGRLCGIDVPSSILEEKKNKYGSIYLSKRFDRNKEERIHYASAMTLLGATDTDKNKHSYIELFNIINLVSKNIKKDKEELFGRIIFNILINNCDDHLRNHGFIYKHNAWSLAPAFDVNISVDTNTHALLFVDDDSDNISNIYEIGKYLGYESNYIEERINKFIKIIDDNLEKIAKKYFAKESEIKIMKGIINKNRR